MESMRFFLIDRITLWEPGVRAEAVKNVALSEDFFDDHFPLKPVMPGALIVEGMAQLAGVLLEESVRRENNAKVKALLSIVEKAKFRRMVHPGDRLDYAARVLLHNDLGGRVEANASVDGAPAAACTLAFSFRTDIHPLLEKKRDEILSFWLRDARKDG